MRASEIFARAREADLPSMWGGPLYKGNGRYTSPWTPCCGEATRKDRGSISKVDGIWRFRCFACGKGGTAIDLVAIVEVMSPEDAAKKIVKGMGMIKPDSPTPAPKPVETPAPEKANADHVAAVIKVIQKHPLTSCVSRYLQDRGLRPETIQEAKRRGFIACLPSDPEEAMLWLEAHVGRELMAAAGMWTKRWPAAAYRPLVLINGSGKTLELRMITDPGTAPKAIQYGVQDHPLVWKPAKGKAKRIIVTEGGIDLLSLVDMGDVDDALLIGIFGTSSWRNTWGRQIAEKYPEAEWEIATDDDDPGHACAEAIAVQLDGMGKPWKRRLPFAGKDWNDALQFIAA